MAKPIRILLQTTLPPVEDDWNIGRFSMLRDYLVSLKDESGNPLYEVTARNRECDSKGNDPILSNLSREQFDELWLFALDVGEGLSDLDRAGITRFHQEGGGILSTRDHQDMGISMCDISTIGCFHHFHTKQPELDKSRCTIDDNETTYISWPNYHSGNNGDYQVIKPLEPVHELLKNPDSPTGVIEFFPAHPHEGAVSVPEGHPYARVIATGTSKVTNRSFNLAVAVEGHSDDAGHNYGRVVAESTFHHFVDYNWDPDEICPSFVDEPPGDTMQTEPRAMEDIYAYVRNLAQWLAPAQ